MSLINKTILKKANEAVSEGDHEKFLSHCADDSVWIFVGDQSLHRKAAIRAYLRSAYPEPPKFDVTHIIAEDELVTVVGKISLKRQDGTWSDYEYCDVWRFREGKMFELKAFVI